MSRFHLIVAATVAAGLAVLYGCALAEQPAPGPTTTVTAQPEGPNSSGTPVAGDSGDTAAPEPAPVRTGTAAPVDPPPTTPPPPTPPATTQPVEQPVAVRPGSINGVRVNASMYPVRRGGQTVTANVLLETRTPGESFMLRGELSDGDQETGSSSDDAVDGLRLVDAVNKKMYLPATTGDGVCACTPADDRGWQDEEALWVSVVFAAPPAEVTAVGVSVPGFGTIPNVPPV